MPARTVAQRRVFTSRKPCPRMSWHPHNIFNIWKLTDPTSIFAREIDFKGHKETIYQERFKSKRWTTRYHADFIASKVFKRWYLPEALPTIRSGDHTAGATNQLSKWVEGRVKAGGRSQAAKQYKNRALDGRSPVGTLMYAEVERRIDVCVFRSCFASSVWMARRFVRQGAVKVNGKVITNANTLMSPGDVFTVNPDVVPFIRPNAWGGDAEDPSEAAEAAESAEAEEAEVTEAEEAAAEEAETASEEDAPVVAEAAETDSTKPTEEFAEVEVDAEAPEQPAQKRGEFFHLPDFAQTHLFVPAYLLPSYLTCSAVYVRHPTARPDYSEIPSPYNAGGPLMSLSWEWFQKVAPRMKQSRRLRLMDPQRSQDRK